MKTLNETNYRFVGIKQVDPDGTGSSRTLYVFSRRGVSTLNYEMYDSVRFKASTLGYVVLATDQIGNSSVTPFAFANDMDKKSFYVRNAILDRINHQVLG